ncbi:AMP-binding protein, partial [Salmonella enterica]|uniref:AMP-binding protein n=1 Tax=Salmonella enterica TaxID=28901 RepID=UPI00398C5718
YEDGTLNLAANCLDRPFLATVDRTSISCSCDDTSQIKHISSLELHRDVCRFANPLLDLGIKKGDVVATYMPLVPEAAVAMLACARIGWVPSVTSRGFPPIPVPATLTHSDPGLGIPLCQVYPAGHHL